ncbi:MAG: MotB family protein, partial [Gammaproteobacteria bacterium]
MPSPGMENGARRCEEGLPPWLATFADLMSLLMCFFVLLLSFAEIDAVRFKKMAESLKDAFGVQREIPAQEIVKGVSVIKQEWSPSVSTPSLVDEIRQQTSAVERQHLDMGGKAELAEDQVKSEMRELIEQDLQEQLAELQDALGQEIDEGMVTVEKEGAKIIIRINEKGSFPSGSARLDPSFQAVMDRISKVLAAKPGRIVVSGHTDDVPISSGRFRSNWELAAARAVTVLHAMLENPNIDPARLLVEGYAETRPLAPNDSPANRAR